MAGWLAGVAIPCGFVKREMQVEMETDLDLRRNSENTFESAWQSRIRRGIYRGRNIAG